MSKVIKLINGKGEYPSILITNGKLKLIGTIGLTHCANFEFADHESLLNMLNYCESELHRYNSLMDEIGDDNFTDPRDEDPESLFATEWDIMQTQRGEQ